MFYTTGSCIAVVGHARIFKKFINYHLDNCKYQICSVVVSCLLSCLCCCIPAVVLVVLLRLTAERYHIRDVKPESEKSTLDADFVNFAYIL